MKTVSSTIVWQESTVTRRHKELQNGHRSAIVWFTGLPSSGKPTMAHAVEEKLHQIGCRTAVLDGDNVRHGLCSDLGFSAEDRTGADGNDPGTHRHLLSLWAPGGLRSRAPDGSRLTGSVRGPRHCFTRTARDYPGSKRCVILKGAGVPITGVPPRARAIHERGYDCKTAA